MQNIVDDLKPEAVYFGDENGMRTAYLFLNIKDNSEIPAIAEPFFLAFNAHVEVHPAMNARTWRRRPPRSRTPRGSTGHR